MANRLADLFSLLTVIVVVVGIAGVAFAFFGVWLVSLGATGDTEFSFFGQTLKSASVGVPAIFIGGAVTVLTVRRLLKTVEEWLRQSPPELPPELREEGWIKITIEDGKLTAEKETGKIVVQHRGSCVGPHPLAKSITSVMDGAEVAADDDGVILVEGGEHRTEDLLEHRIYFEVLNLFSRPVAVVEHRVISLLDGDIMRGYRYQPDELSSLAPEETRRFTVYTPMPITERIRDHLEKFDTEQYGLHGLTQAVVISTSEGVLEPLPVFSVSQTIDQCDE